MGRFTTPDPSRRFNPGDPRSLNQYSYTGNDPVNATDRSGLYWELLGCEDAGYLDAESEIAGIPWRNCYYTSVDDEYATGPVQRPRIRRGGGGGASADRLGKLLDDALARAEKALRDPDCASIFSLPAGESLSGLLSELSKGSTRGNIGFDDLGPATRSPNGSLTGRAAHTVGILGSGPVSKFVGGSIAVNSNSDGTFVRPRGYLGLSDAQNQSATVIHELGHWVNLVFGTGSSAIQFEGDDPDGKINKANNELIKQKCFP